MDGPRLWDRRVRAEALRGYPLEDVVRRLGYRRDPTDAARWRRPGSVVSINGFMFYQHLRGEGGGGAIDLVIHACQCTVSIFRIVIMAQRYTSMAGFMFTGAPSAIYGGTSTEGRETSRCRSAAASSDSAGWTGRSSHCAFRKVPAGNFGSSRPLIPSVCARGSVGNCQAAPREIGGGKNFEKICIRIDDGLWRNSKYDLVETYLFCIIQ